MPNAATILGLLGFGNQTPGYQPNPETFGLLDQLNRLPNGMQAPEQPNRPDLMQQLNRGPDGMPSPALGLPSLFQGVQGAVNPDVAAMGANPASAGPVPMPPVRPEGLGFNRPMQADDGTPMPPVRPAGLGMAHPAPIAPGSPQTPPQATPAPEQSGLSRFGDVIGSIYGKGGPGDNLIALGAGLASGPNWGSGLMKGMSMVNATTLAGKKAGEDQRRLAGQQMLAKHIETQSQGKIPAAAALGIVQSGNASQFLSEQFRKPDDPASLREWNAYAQQERTAGRQPEAYQAWLMKMKQIESGAGETSFERQAGELQAKRYGEAISAGDAAKGAMSDIAQLREISERFGSQGSAADVKARLGPMAEALGIKIDGLDDIQAFNSIIQRVAPTLRAPGSGSTSDIEFKGMLASFPQLSSNPAARAAILDTMEAMARDKVSRGEIASKVLNREMTRQEGESALRDLGDPMAAFRAYKKAAGDQQQQTEPQAPATRPRWRVIQ